MANDKAKELLGSWKHESADNVDAYLKKSGIGMVLRTVAKAQKPVVKITLEGDVWHVFIESAFKNHDWSFKLGEKFKLTTIDGRVFWATVTLDSNGHLIETQEVCEGHEKNTPSVVTRYVENGKLITVETCGDVSAKRIFARV